METKPEFPVRPDRILSLGRVEEPCKDFVENSD